MTDHFDIIVADVKCKFGDLQASTKHCMAKLPRNMPSAGIYLLSENGRPLYVGRTSNLRNRLQYHMRNNHNQATFAFLLARHHTNLKVRGRTCSQILRSVLRSMQHVRGLEIWTYSLWKKTIQSSKQS